MDLTAEQVELKQKLENQYPDHTEEMILEMVWSRTHEEEEAND